ncbi:MAG: replicative DNA helicase [Ruminococcaceae bacterium]|nr:replicative DNA helicase [Oscillospiraceae bacterium]
MADLLENIRQVPYSLEAEQSVIGSILLSPDCINEIASFLRPEHFYIAQNRIIYETLLHMNNESAPIDAVTLLERLRDDGNYDEAGGKTYLVQTAEIVPSSSNVKAYANIVCEKANLRKLINVTDEIRESCYEGSDASSVIDLAEQRIYDVSNGRATKEFENLSEVMVRVFDKLEMLRKDKKAFSGTPTYYDDVDKFIIGLNATDLVLVAGRPGMGKTSFAMNIATNVAKNGKKTAVFSLEMSNDQLAERILSSEALVDNKKLRSGELDTEDWAKLWQAMDALYRCPILLDDTAGINATEIKAKLRRVKDLELVVIDYLGLMSSAKKAENRVNEVAEISRSLKLMAKDLGVPIIVCAQLNRGAETRPGGHRPMMSDLRDSGAIEQDADIIMLLYRDEYYNKESEKRGIAECIIAKNRHGNTGTAELRWIDSCTRFTSLEKSNDGQ